MLIADVQIERYYWQKHYVTPVTAPANHGRVLMSFGNRYAMAPREFTRALPCGTFPGMHVLRRVLVEHREKGRLHIVRFEWRMDELRRWRYWGIPDVTTARTLVKPCS